MASFFRKLTTKHKIFWLTNIIFLATSLLVANLYKSDYNHFPQLNADTPLYSIVLNNDNQPQQLNSGYTSFSETVSKDVIFDYQSAKASGSGHVILGQSGSIANNGLTQITSIKSITLIYDGGQPYLSIGQVKNYLFYSDDFTSGEPIYVNNDAYFFSINNNSLEDTLIESVIISYSCVMGDSIIFFNSKGGTAVSNITQARGTPINAPVAPTREGYVFSGWYSDSLLSQIFNFDVMPQSNITLYAKWTANNYTLTFNSNGGSTVSNITQGYESQISLPTPTKNGYTFKGWYKDNTTFAQLFNQNQMPLGNLTLYAKWSLTNYVITYVLNGGMNHPNNAHTYTIEDRVLLSNGSRSGYTPLGWWDNPSFLGSKINIISKGSTGDKTFYAKFERKQVTIEFITNGGSYIDDLAALPGAPIDPPTPPTRDHHAFQGWFSDEQLTIAYTFSIMPETSLSLYAKWTVIYPDTYKKVSHTINGAEIVQQFSHSELILAANMTASSDELDMFSRVQKSGSYTITGNGVNVTLNGNLHSFTYDGIANQLVYQTTIDSKTHIIRYGRGTVSKLTGNGTISFTQLSSALFGENLSQNYYNYAPTIMMEGPNIMHIYYCSNKTNGNITDYIAYRRGELKGNGKWTFSTKTLLLEPTPGTWDARHTCDPSVIKGEFTYNAIEYNYLMAYLGCITNDSSRNEVGIAVSKNPQGPWVKIHDINPIANYYTSNDYIGAESMWTWGYGQPSLVSVDKKGEILLFYTKGVKTGTYQQVEYWDLSNLNNPIKKESQAVSNSGIVNAMNGADAINNADFVYDQFSNRMIVIKEDYPSQSNEEPTAITSSNTLHYLSLTNDNEYMGETFFKPVSKMWQKMETIGPSATGFARNHNMGLVSDEYGWLINPYQIPVIFTRSDLASSYPNWNPKGGWQSLHTYRMYGYLIEL